MYRLATVSLALALCGVADAARPLTFCDVCDGFMLTRKGNDLVIRCPNVIEPWLVIKDCMSPSAKRLGNNKVAITCT